jgi:Ca2+-transporting ATPase
MQEPPRKPTAGLLSTRDYLGILWVGVWMGAAAIACYLWPGFAGVADRPRHVRAAAFCLLALSPLFHAFNCRSPRISLFLQRPFVSIPLVVSVVISAGIHLVSVLVPTLWPVFRTGEAGVGYMLDGYSWIVTLLLSASIIPAVEAAKAAQRSGLFSRS